MSDLDMKCYYDGNITCLADCELIEECQARGAMLKGRTDAIDEVIKLARAEIDFESQAEQKRFIGFMEALKEKADE